MNIVISSRTGSLRFLVVVLPETSAPDCFVCFFSLRCPNSSAKSSFLGFTFFLDFGAFAFSFLVAACVEEASVSAVIPTILRFFKYTKKLMTKEERLSPPIPMMANRPAGRTVRQTIIILVVKVTGSWNTGTPMSSARIRASTAFLSLMVPPNIVPVSIKFGGMMYISFSSCPMDILDIHDTPPEHKNRADL